MKAFVSQLKALIFGERYKTLVENILALSTLQVLSNVLPLIVLPYLQATIGNEKYGLFFFAQSVVGILALFSNMAFNTYGAREISIHRDSTEMLSKIFSCIFTLNVLLVVLLFGVLNTLMLFWGRLGDEWLLYQITFAWLLIGPLFLAEWFFIGMEKIKYISIINMIIRVFFTIMIFVVVKSPDDFIYVPLFYAVGFILSGMASMYLIFFVHNIKYRIPKVSTLTDYVYNVRHLFLAQFSGGIYVFSNVFILGVVTNNYTIVAYYAIPERLIRAMLRVVVPISQALFPYFGYRFSKQSVRESIQSLFRLNKYYIPLTIAGALGFAVSVFILERYFFKDAVNFIANNLIMAAIIPLNAIMNLYGITGLVNLKYEKQYGYCVLITLCVSICSATVLSYLFADIGTAISYLLTEALLAFLVVWKINQIYRNAPS